MSLLEDEQDIDLIDYAFAFWQVWSTRSVETFEEKVWRRLAYATRYGHIPLSEALSLATEDLVSFNNALDGIVQEENKPKGG